MFVKIKRKEHLKSKDLSQCARTSTSQNSRYFNTCEKSTSDKRQYPLTSKGKNIIPIIEKINAQWENEIGLNDVSDEFNKTFTRLTFKSVELNK